MLLDLLTLTTALTSRGVLASENAQSLAADAAEVASVEEPLFSGEKARERTARLLVVWAARESAGHVSILGDCANPKKKTVDTCASYGRLQTSKAWLLAFDTKPADVLSDGRLSLRVGLSVMRRLRDTCGSVKAGLRAYGSGLCAGTVRARQIAEQRCQEAGGC